MSDRYLYRKDVCDGHECIADCDMCMWQDKILEAERMERKKTEVKDVEGILFVMPTMSLSFETITVRVTKDERGESLSLADEKVGIMLEIPLEPLHDVLKVVCKSEADVIYRTDAIYHCRKRLYQTAEANGPIDVYADIAENRIGKWLNELPSAQ